ncbi:MAG: sensor histidine kinase [Symbiobacteriia bacterium]
MGTTKRWKEKILAVPTFYKILAANSAIVVLGAVLGTYITGQVLTNGTGRVELVLLFALAGLALSLPVNAIVLRAAFLPLSGLGRVLDEVRGGNMGARVGSAPLTDPDIDRMADTLNKILDAVQSYNQQVNALSRQVLAAQEAERMRIARELHDETAQALTYMMLRLKMAERTESSATTQEMLGELHGLAAKTLEGIKRLAVELRPAALDDLGLAAALEAHVQDYSRRVGTPVSFETSGLEERLPENVEIVVYRVAQEALTNAAKYAAANHIEVKLRCEAGKGLSLLVRDDGCGFDLEAARRSKTRGLGLFGMQERVHLVGGHIEWKSAPGKGTAVKAWIPLGDANEERHEQTQ